MRVKRRSSTRVTRETPRKKKQQALPSPDREPSTHEGSKQPSPTPTPEPHLPTKISDDSPLPTSEHHQRVSDDLLQSLYESGVLAASLQRSRVKWLGEGLFQRYWTKPTKKKGQVVEPPNNPPKDTMHKIGTCRIMIEPHIFDAILYSIRDPHVTPPEPATASFATHMSPLNHPSTHYHYPATPISNPEVSLQRYPYPGPGTTLSPHPSSHSQYHQTAPLQGATSTHVWQNTTPSNIHVPSPVSSPAPRASFTTQSPLVPNYGPQPTSKSSAESASTNTPQPTSQQTLPMQQQTNHTASQHSCSQSVHQAAPVTFQTSDQTSNPPISIGQENAQSQNQPSPAPPPKPSQDPVIQMLAQRASTSPELKVLMKIVASGTASTEQLKIFQSHIDELTAILHDRRQAGDASSLAPTPATASPQPPTVTTQQTNVPAPASAPAHLPAGAFPTQYPSPLGSRPPINMMPSKTLPYYTASPPINMKPKQFVPPKPEITGVAIEFVAGSGDRFLFPKHCILEFIPQLRQVLASFLIVLKGEAAARPEPAKYEADKSYHQPVTIRIVPDHPRVMEMISRAVATYDDARKHMEETIKTTKRADDVHLAIRLPMEEAVSGNKDDKAAADGANPIPVPPVEKEKKQRAKQSKAASMPKVDPFKNNCLFCFGPLDGSTATADGQRSCADCAALCTKQSSLSSVPKSGVGPDLRQPKARYSGPHTLTLPVA